MKTLFLNNIVWIVLAAVYIFFPKEKDTVVFLDVGQGDAILIQNGSEQMLIDGGPDNSVLYSLQRYMPFFDRKIEYVVLTHPHNDHLIGLLKVLENYEVEQILYYPVCYENENYEYFLQRYSNIKKVGKGDTISLGYIDIDILWPILHSTQEGCVESFNGNINNDSLVLEFEYIGKKFLLMGDIESEVEEVLIRDKIITSNYNILKAGHHCSNTSNSETFLKVVSPDMAVCSVGLENPFGHPGGETLKNFSKYNVQYLITYKEGNIQIK